MILRFEVNQAEAFRQGINVPKSTCHLEVDPATLDQTIRNLIADRMDGIDVCRLDVWGTEIRKVPSSPDSVWHRIVAHGPDFESLMAAIFENEADVTAQVEKAKSPPVIRSGLISIPL